MFKKTKNFIPLPFYVYYWPIVFFAVSGVGISIYLFISHYRVYTDITYSSFCAISKRINCDTVSQSPYSILFGVPVSVWGVIGYAFFIQLLVFAGKKDAEKKRLWSLMYFTALFFNIYSVILALISNYIIHSYCIMCITAYVINFILLFYCWFINSRFGEAGVICGFYSDCKYLLGKKKEAAAVFLSFAVIIILIMVFCPKYWEFIPPHLPVNIRKGITSNGHPFVGAENAKLKIIEFTDYRCFQCNKMHFFIRQLVAKYPERILLVHRHFPMDHTVNPVVKKTFHEGSGTMALLAIYAAGKGRFWEMNDLLFDKARQKGVINIEELAQKTGLDYNDLKKNLYNKKNIRKLRIDINAAIKNKISGTPAYVVNGKIYSGDIPKEILEKVLY